MEQNNVELMRIAGITELEVAWSNIYAYYMNPRNEPEYASAFTTALLELCGLNRAEVLPDDNYCVKTEVPTSSCSESKKNGRIDILIEGEKSIIIENKINHVLNNPLDEYWDYAINPVVLVVLTISRMSDYELKSYCFSMHKRKEDADRIKCVNITHYELITKTKKILGREFESLILKELENLIIKKTIVMPEKLYISNDEERLEVNRIYENEFKRRQLIAKECEKLKAFDLLDSTGCDSANHNSTVGEPIITFKSCPNNNYLHFRYRGQDDLVIGVLCAYLWDWERYERDLSLRVERSGPELKHTPVITLFVQVHGNLYREMRQNKEKMVEKNGYEISGRFCHVIDFDIDMSEMSERFRGEGELANFLTTILQDHDKCPIIGVAETIYNTHISKKIPPHKQKL